MLEQVAEVIQVIPQERVLERTVEQIKDVPVIAEQLTPEVPQSQCLRRAVHVPNEVSERPPSPGRRLIRTGPRGSELFDELKPDCTNSSSAHADRPAAREQ